ncbi:DNA-binding protein [Phlyctema vagabunda]|uniref:DNA-binding protein n=1 Tax=Phlyctema vagabunda TaxID=108571 RepID=A0ABR4PK57_9HELO
MLLPSALSCEASQQTPRTRYQSSLFASPPPSPQPSPQSAINGLFSTCRALQSMLSPQPTQPTQLPSPPMQHAEIGSPFKLRLRARKSAECDALPRKRITKRNAPPPRGINKRRRSVDEVDSEEEECPNPEPVLPSTPKRLRLAPPVLPLGLERSDFHTLDTDTGKDEVLESIEDNDMGEDAWSTEEDRMLVELVLEKLKLSKSEWQDCARSLGKDRGSVGKRWKSLMGSGEVGLKNRQRRSKIHGSWR